jgi:hypothetical protein
VVAAAMQGRGAVVVLAAHQEIQVRFFTLLTATGMSR